MKIARYSVFDGCIVSLRTGSTILSLQRQDGIPVIWVEEDPNNPDLHDYRVRVYYHGYGDIDVAENLCYVGSLLDDPYACQHYYLDRSNA